jgi:hypothetical protein
VPVKGRTRCRFHGGANPGPIGKQNALKSGKFTAEAKRERAEKKAARRAARSEIGRLKRKAAHLVERLKAKPI